MPGLQKLVGFLNDRFNREILAHHVIGAVQGDFVRFPDTLHGELARVLREQGIESLYSHQGKAFDRITAGQDTVLVSTTAR